jgi:cobalamin biosynthesis Mg chelatase CobN
MAIPSFFKQNKPRGFNYTPRYYDPAREELEQRRKAWSKESSSARATEEGTKREEDGPTSDKGTGNRPSSAKPTEGGANQPYRSRIMRGDMRNHFQRRKERVERHTSIRLLVIIIIIVLVVYLYLRF